MLEGVDQHRTFAPAPKGKPQQARPCRTQPPLRQWVPVQFAARFAVSLGGRSRGRCQSNQRVNVLNGCLGLYPVSQR